jgi:hypothetical protein
MRLLICTILGLLYSNLYAQKNELGLYRKAYQYINDSIVQPKNINDEELHIFCSKYIEGVKLNYQVGPHVANVVIQNGRGLPFEDIFRKNYSYEIDCCIRNLRLGGKDCPVVNQYTDSLTQFWSGYQIISKDSILNTIQPLISTQRNGFIIFFSDVYKNTLSAELQLLCKGYGNVPGGQGSPLSIFFIFNYEGEISEVYSGHSIHYQ